MLGGRALVDAIRHNTTLVTLELSGSDVLLESLQAVEDILRANRVTFQDQQKRDDEQRRIQDAAMALAKQYEEQVKALQQQLAVV